ncbi:MAG: transposase [Pseudomonadota bacterium]
MSWIPQLARDAIAELWDLRCDLDRRITQFDKKIAAVFKASPNCQRTAQIEGVDPKTAAAIGAAIGDGKAFRNGRHCAARLSLVPCRHSSSDKRPC